MSKASTSSLQHLLRQLYHAKNSLASAAAAEALSISGSSGGGGSNSSGTAWSSGTPAAAYSTAARSLHVLPAAGDASPTTSSIHHQHHTPSSTGEWATSSSTPQASGSGNSSSSSSGSSSNHNSNTAKTRNATPHHYHRHNASNHHHHPPHVAAASNNLLQSSFWIQPPSSGTTPPLPPFTSNSSPSSSSSSSTGHAVTPATTSSSSASSSLSATSTASQPADASYPAPFTPNPTSADASTSPDASAQHQQEQQSNSQISTSSHHLTLHPGAYGIPKRLSASPRNTTPPASSAKGKGKEVDMDESLQAQLEQLQQSLLSVQVGEDAYFVRHDALGVADGVGGWSGRKGADPGLFAARLMHHCSAELALAEEEASKQSSTGTRVATSTENGSSSKSKSKLAFVSSASATANLEQSAGKKTPNGERERKDDLNEGVKEGDKIQEGIKLPPEHVNANDTSLTTIQAGDPIELLHRAWDLTLTEFFDYQLIGSSTALIALLKDDELRLANIGDCCCSIIRGEEGYIFRSQEQQHSFNYPFQMGTNSKDTPRKDGQRFNIKVQKNDLVILSSDGLVDNLFDEDILEEIERQQEEFSNSDGDEGGRSRIVSPERLSKALCSRAKAVSEDQRAVTSPFQQRANEEGIHFVGGKHDDITVLVAIIGDKNEGVSVEHDKQE